MKIGCIGIGGTGKTKFAKKLAKKLDLPFLPSVTRGVYISRDLTEQDVTRMSPGERLELQGEIILARSAAENKQSDYVSDRTMLDHIAYYMYTCQMGEEEWKIRLEYLKNNMDQYDYLFFFPRDSGWWPEDGFRSRSFSQAYVLELTMGNLITKCVNDAYLYDMISGSVKDRVKWARGIIQ